MDKVKLGILDVHGDAFNRESNLFQNNNVVHLIKDDCHNLQYCDAFLCPLNFEYLNIYKKPIISVVYNRFNKMDKISFLHNKYIKSILCHTYEDYDFFVNYKPTMLINSKVDFPYLNLNYSHEAISSLIINYQRLSDIFIRNNTKSIQVFEYIKKYSKYKINNYENAIDYAVLLNSRYLIHIKYSGAVCNAVIKSLACGVPVILDKISLDNSGLDGYIFHMKNAFIGTSQEILDFINSDTEPEIYLKLKNFCIKTSEYWKLPYKAEERLEADKLVSACL